MRHGRMTYEQGWLFECLALAQLQNGQHEQALRTARTLVERCRASDMPRAEDCQGRGFVAQAMAEVELGRHREALDSVQKRMELPHSNLVRFPDLAIAYGRALLADGRPGEAVEPLRLAYGRFLSRFPGDAQAAEAEYWFALAYLAAGDPRGRWMLAEAKKALSSSPIRSHRLLAARPGP
jgi:tetratricopeptide (TPR) repeat protein